ncbi:MAG: T9SS type A sorting domain-containing protein [Bacteroidales bacterium]|nr:T9SS type A sorting domain-containing protein [Bacteroidales bacterium]
MKNILSLLLGICLTASLSAQDPGDLDLNYGIDGIATFSFTGQSTMLFSISRQSNDRIIIGGFMEDLSTFDTYVIATRMDETGSVDNFGNNITYFANYYDDTESVLATYVLPNDEIIIAGYYGEGYPFVSRLDQDGSLDPFFAGTGSYINESTSFVPTCIDVYNTIDGYNIVMSGYSVDYEPLMLCIDQDGTAVTSFGSDGLYEFPVSLGIMRKLTIDSDAGCIYTCGDDIAGVNAFISKHNLSDGSLITSFNGTGYVILEPFGDALSFSARGLAYNAGSGTLAILGDYLHIDTDYDIFAVRFNTSDGSLDNSFGLNGWSTLRFPTSNEAIYDAVQQSDGKYYLGGFTNINDPNDFMIGRINNNGILDMSFGVNGFTLTDLGEQDRVVDLVLSENQSRIFAGGDMNPFGHHEMKVACYHTGFTMGVADPETVQPEISIYPNPTTDIINIETGEDDSYQIGIYDLAGKRLLQRDERGNKFQLDIKELPKGIYMLRLTNSNNNNSNFKLIKQ